MVPVTISDDAMNFIKEKLKHGDSDSLIIFFEGFGWAGPKFSIDVLKSPKEGDELIYEGDFKIYLDKIAKQFLNEVHIILKKSLFGGPRLAVKGFGGGSC